jgi:hypothetical protein
MNIEKYIKDIGNKHLIFPHDYFVNNNLSIREFNNKIESKKISLMIYYKDPFIINKNTIKKSTLKKIAKELDFIKYINNCKGFVIEINDIKDYRIVKKNINYLFEQTEYNGEIFLDYQPTKEICENEEYIEDINNFFTYLEKEEKKNKIDYLDKLKININLQYLYHSGIELENYDNIKNIIKKIKKYISYVSINNSSTYPYNNKIEKTSIHYGKIPILIIKRIIKIINNNKLKILLDTNGDYNREIQTIKNTIKNN